MINIVESGINTIPIRSPLFLKQEMRKSLLQLNYFRKYTVLKHKNIDI